MIQDKIYNESNLETMSRMPDNFIDLTVTSPPYDNLRTYNGYEFDFESIAKELFRVTKDGGVVVWVVGDATIKGSETGTSFRHALFFMECGFRLHDTMIYKTHKPPMNDRRYQACFEYMFVLSKGRPKTFFPIKVDSKKAGQKRQSITHWNPDGSKKLMSKGGEYSLMKTKESVWIFASGNNGDDKDSMKHPARFPEQLANDHIISWSNEEDLVYDPFMGSGTTAKMAILNNRRYIGSEISQEYCDIATKRIHEAKQELTLFK